MTNANRPLRSTAVLWLSFAVFCCVSSFGALRKNTFGRVAPAGENGADRFVRRFDGVHAHLPKSGVVGYASDGTWVGRLVPGEPFQDTFLSRFALLPAIAVPPSPTTELIVGNFADATAARRYAERHELAVVADLENGVVVLRRPR